MERWIMIAALAFIAGTAYEILKRLKMLQVVEARRALNFAHIEAEFSALRVMLGHLHNDEDFVERTDILKTRSCATGSKVKTIRANCLWASLSLNQKKTRLFTVLITLRLSRVNPIQRVYYLANKCDVISRKVISDRLARLRPGRPAHRTIKTLSMIECAAVQQFPGADLERDTICISQLLRCGAQNLLQVDGFFRIVCITILVDQIVEPYYRSDHTRCSLRFKTSDLIPLVNTPLMLRCKPFMQPT